MCANSQVERTQKRGGRDRFAPAPPACYEAVVELAEPLAEDPDEEPPVDPAEPLLYEELPVPVELPVPLALPDSVPLVDDPLVLPDPEAELSDDAVPS